MVLITKAITEKVMVAFGHHNDPNGNPIIPLDEDGNYMHYLIDALFDTVHGEHDEMPLMKGEVIKKHDDYKTFEEILEEIEEQPDLIRGLMNVRDAGGNNIFVKAIEQHCYEIVIILIDHNVVDHNLHFTRLEVGNSMFELLDYHNLLSRYARGHKYKNVEG